MSMTEQTTGDFDPFHPDNVGTLNYIMLARIYDLLMLDLDARFPEKAKQVLDLHAKGYILGTPPVLNGEFLVDAQEEAPAESAN